ncbi:hypothetical protein Pint_32390 [Pistacia integerrima]|uniref:Uncharacterized protein n=1 Tax=Pistacia integerrima TaxID=434235 RepID=A0ACC0XN43_9ROSI|nr:hypothetical protein Pint_32390 [Pistacia integerrima]
MKTSDWVKIADEVFASLEKEDGNKEIETQPIEKARGRKIEKKSSKKKQDKPVKSSRIVKETTKSVAEELPERKNEPEIELDFEACKGRFIYIPRIPRRFNEDLLRHCDSLSFWCNMCEFISNKGWFATNQFMLEVIFHNRMKQYKCLTSNSSLASAIFLPYYPGLDLNRYLWYKNTMKMKDIEALEFVKWLRRRPEWKRMHGRDHFLVGGRVSWDFLRATKNDSDWGNRLLRLPQTRNMTMLVIESSPWNNNDFAIPYPTYFHPSNDSEVLQWQNRMREQERPFLISFVGGKRSNSHNSIIRNEVIDQCRASRKCRLMECSKRQNLCYEPIQVMKMFQSSVFCLQPEGDSYTRRSTFDSILAGCIPVFFHPGSAYVQYTWHLPKDYTKYSVFIPDIDVKNGKVSIEMREEVIRLIPRVIYADPNGRLESLEDAFDITVKGVLDRVEKIRKEMNEGKNLSTDIAERFAWKYNLFGTVGKHEWDPFFVQP